MMIEEHTVKYRIPFLKLKQMLYNGYLPSRNLSLYNDENVEKINALGHAVFNPTDEFLKGFTKNDREVFCLGLSIGEFYPEILENRFAYIMSLYDLEVHPCKINDIMDERSSKLALYTDEYGSDYHILREEQNGIWTHKPGFYNNIQMEARPHKYIFSKNHEYTFAKTLRVTYPHGKNILDRNQSNLIHKEENLL